MCGIIGIYKANGKDVSADIYDGLIQVQHRGQDASGISTWNNSKIFMHKNLGLVSEVFKKESLLKLNGNIGIGHVRYPSFHEVRSHVLMLCVNDVRRIG